MFIHAGDEGRFAVETGGGGGRESWELRVIGGREVLG